MNSSSAQQLFIPFHLGDPAGILFFAHAFTLSHQIFEQFVIQTLECPWNHWFQHPEWIVPIKKTEAEFKAPLRCGEWCQVIPSIVAITSTSFTFRCEFFQPDLCCAVQSVHVFCERQARQKIPIPQNLRLTLESVQNLTVNRL